MPEPKKVIHTDGLGDYDPYSAEADDATLKSDNGSDVWTRMARMEEENRRLRALLRQRDEELAQCRTSVDLLTQTVSGQQQTILHLIYNNKRLDDTGELPLQSNIDVALERLGLYLGNNEQRNCLASELKEMFKMGKLRVRGDVLMVRNGYREQLLKLLFKAMRREQRMALTAEDNTVALARLKDYLHRNLYSFKGERETQVDASHFDSPLRRIIGSLRHERGAKWI